MNKNEMTTAMFEEIKEMMSSIDKKIDELSVKDSMGSSEESKPKEDETKQIKVGEYLDYLAKRTGKNIQNSAELFAQNSSALITRFEIQASSIRSSFEPILKYLKKRKSLTNKLIVFQLLFVVSLITNLYLLNDNHRLNDSDLQLKYLKVTNSVDQEMAGRLDSIFNVYRNEETIEFIKQTVHE